MPRTPTLILILTLSTTTRAADHAPAPEFDRIVIDDNFPGAYQVEIADINGDKKLDIIALGGSTVAWYENPTWKKRIITNKSTTPGVISSASRDLDGDGRAEIAIAYDFEMNQPHRGELLLASQGETPDDPWTTKHLGHFPSIHRLRWGDFDNDGLPDLIIAPIFGENAKPPTYDQDPATLLCLRTTQPIKKAQEWKFDRMPLMKCPVMHAIDVVEPISREPFGPLPAAKSQVLSASNLGVGAVFHDPEMAVGDEAPLIPVTIFPGAQG
ncbi:MAG TPA: VCBS repeat-containing protein, partial [Isosphaeraceae bacterium]|nr:VCBS repeat-containing protein [Isosphaeraceae bacterium]